MRVNEPVTQREFALADDAILMSTTDTQSYISYANDAFLEVSGFGREEIQGQPHNLVRHPDMPPAAFADMWATLKGGEPWTALVKNRRKNGDHYWVRANAVPVVRNGRQVGYMSVRTTPSRDEVAAAEALYRDLREGRAGSRMLRKGVLVRKGWQAWRSWGRTLSVRSRIRWTMALMSLFLLGGAALLTADLQGLLELGGAMALASMAACWALEQQIAAPLELLRRQALAVATGEDRNVRHMDRLDEIGMTMRSISQLGLMFRWLLDDVRQQVMSVQTASAELAQGNKDLSSRTDQAASNVQETASAMEQMAGAVRNNADTATQATQLSGAASETATQGGRAMHEVVTTMGEISESSKKISDIIGVIDGIAFQTNILALNAAVEAARAGEQGRGFAVVAGEVRSLAQRSAEAAKEIKNLIGASVDRVESGSRLVDDAGRTMQDIVHQVKRVSDLIGEISTATHEQSSGIAQVGQAVAQLDQITQQNAALVEQGAAASQGLRQQAQRLTEAVNVFC